MGVGVEARVVTIMRSGQSARLCARPLPPKFELYIGASCNSQLTARCNDLRPALLRPIGQLSELVLAQHHAQLVGVFKDLAVIGMGGVLIV